MSGVSLDCPLCGAAETRLFCSRGDAGLGLRDYFKCPACSLVFLSPEKHLGPVEEKKRYDSHRNDPADEGYVKFLNRLAEPLSLLLNPGASGLDFGCGPGPAMSGLMRARGFFMADYDPFYRPEASLLESTYDFITCTEVMEHLFMPGREFVLLDRLLRPGGLLGVMTGVLEDENAFENWWYPRDPTHVCFYQKKTFEWIAGWRGWQADFPAPNVVIFKKPKAK